MTCQDNYTLPAEIVEQLAAQGWEYLPELIKEIVNIGMNIERQNYVGVEAYKHSTRRNGHSNGYKPKTVKTRMGEITFAIPQVREGGFYPEALEKGLRSERALNMTLAEMYVQGVSTRKVAAIMEQLCGSGVSATQVSKATAQLDEKLEKWRNRPLGKMLYLYLDARYEKVRQDGQVRDAAILIASGVDMQHKRQICGVSVSLSEGEIHWRTFLESLTKRGLRGVQLIISDDHAGLEAARQAVFGGVPWQRCQFHLQQNAQAYVPRKDMQKRVTEDIRAIFNAPDWATAETYLKKTVEKYEKTASKLADWLEKNLPEGLTVLSFPVAHRRQIRTVNSLERLNREIRRRTRVVSIFPNEAACLRLISAILIEISDNWEAGKTYLTMES